MSFENVPSAKTITLRSRDLSDGHSLTLVPQSSIRTILDDRNVMCDSKVEERPPACKRHHDAARIVKIRNIVDELWRRPTVRATLREPLGEQGNVEALRVLRNLDKL